MLATMKTSQRRKAARSFAAALGTRSSRSARSARCSVMAALSVITWPSGSTRTGTCVSGFSGRSLSRATAESNRSPLSSTRNGRPYQASWSSMMDEPHPGRACKVNGCMCRLSVRSDRIQMHAEVELDDGAGRQPPDRLGHLVGVTDAMQWRHVDLVCAPLGERLRREALDEALLHQRR